jgi:hypothetical protein
VTCEDPPAELTEPESLDELSSELLVVELLSSDELPEDAAVPDDVAVSATSADRARAATPIVPASAATASPEVTALAVHLAWSR